jgi:hypothetical protein
MQVIEHPGSTSVEPEHAASTAPRALPFLQMLLPLLQPPLGHDQTPPPPPPLLLLLTPQALTVAAACATQLLLALRVSVAADVAVQGRCACPHLVRCPKSEQQTGRACLQLHLLLLTGVQQLLLPPLLLLMLQVARLTQEGPRRTSAAAAVAAPACTSKRKQVLTTSYDCSSKALAGCVSTGIACCQAVACVSCSLFLLLHMLACISATKELVDR